MDIKLLHEFYNKFMTPEYPILGFRYDVIQVPLPDQSTYTFDDKLLYVTRPGSTDYVCSSYIDKNTLRLEFNTDNKITQGSYVRLYYFDLFELQNEFHSINTVSLRINRNFELSDEIALQRLYNNFAGVIDFDNQDLLNSKSNHIIIINFENDIPCNLIQIKDSEVNGYYNHIPSRSMGQSNSLNMNTGLEDLLESSTADIRLREGLSHFKMMDRDGVMTIKKSGIMQL